MGLVLAMCDELWETPSMKESAKIEIHIRSEKNSKTKEIRNQRSSGGNANKRSVECGSHYRQRICRWKGGKICRKVTRQNVRGST